MSVVDEIKARLDIVDLVSQSVQLRRAGKNYTGFCPFHSNTRTPAFVVFPESGTWRCFGQCAEGGDIFKFVMKKENWDFPEALRFLADKAGVALKPVTPESQAEEDAHAALRTLLEEAVVYYRHQLLNTPAGQAAAGYLRGRGLSDATLEAFGIGYAPQSWDAALRHFTGKGYGEAALLDAGLLTRREPEEGSGPARVYDRFRHRIMIPIRDERGRMAGFGARILDPNDIPKFLNSPQTSVFDKGHLLYGLERARKDIRARNQVVIVEGYLDVIALHQAGFANAVSPMGTALTEDQLRLLKRFSQRIVLALDPDAAGDQATLRGLEVARQALDRQAELVFDARGLVGSEARLQADIRVCALPRGQDPDDVVKRDPAEWERLVAEARPIVVHVMETLAAGRDLGDAKVKSEIAAQVLPLIEEVPNAVERETYRQRLARLLRVDERTLAGAPAAPRRRSGYRRTPGAGAVPLQPGPPTAVHALEAYALGVLLRRPELLYRVDRELRAARQPSLSPDTFQHADHQAIARLLRASVEQHDAEPLQLMLNSLSLPLMELADDLLARTSRMEPSDERVFSDLMRALLELRKGQVRQEVEYVRFLMEDALQAGDAKAPQYRQSMVQHNRILRDIDTALAQYTSRMPAVR